jgi:hypothetical protein
LSDVVDDHHSQPSRPRAGQPFEGDGNTFEREACRAGGIRPKQKVRTVPQVTLRTTVDGREETISEYICDWPDCPRVAVHVIGVVRELSLRTAVCEEHAAQIWKRRDEDARR